MTRAQEAIKDAGVSAKELLAEVEKVKTERFEKNILNSLNQKPNDNIGWVTVW
jgi:hypothetical protein